MNNNQVNKKFDLEDRTLEFAKKVIDLIKKLTKKTVNFELSSQVMRSAGSIGANYREANEALGRKDFFMRIRISRKESKETKYWLELIAHNNPEFKEIVSALIEESSEFIKIFSAIIAKSN
ncbi:four helix bundle protein [Candidatus Daviesbacteria bacterium]|nr:four helix bundle protein [Candidatus Daviesbacteria bacterium]